MPRNSSNQIFISSTPTPAESASRSEEHTSELQSQSNLVCRLLLEKKKDNDVSDGFAAVDGDRGVAIACDVDGQLDTQTLMVAAPRGDLAGSAAEPHCVAAIHDLSL